MPFGDRTGPAGFGPMTGRGAGYCAGYGVPGFMNPVGSRGRGGFSGGFGGGFGRGFGFGRGRWRGAPCYAAPNAMPYAYGTPAAGFYAPPPPSPEQEKDALKSQAEYLQGALEEIKKRLSELETEPARKK